MSTWTYIFQADPDPPAQVPSQAGSWGLGGWGTSSWGATFGEPPPVVTGLAQNIADTAGGTVLAVLGTGFTDPMTVELLSGDVVVGTGLVADPRYDLTGSRVFVGMPALATGFYDLRVTTGGGSATLTNAVEFRPFANELSVETSRRKWARAWNLGPRILGT